MPKTSTGERKETPARSKAGKEAPAGAGKEEPKRKGGVMQSVTDAVRAHPVATAAAVAAGGIAVARLTRGSRRKAAADTQKKPAAKKATAKKAASDKPKVKRAAGGGLAAQVQPDAALGAVVGTGMKTRAEITKALWDYIKKNGLQDATNRRMVNADAKLRPIFGADQVSMFEMTRLVSQHVSKG